MKRYFIHNPLFRLLAPAVYGILLYLLVLLINNNVAQLNEFFSGQEVYICIGLTYLSFESIRLTITLLNKFLPKKYSFIQTPIKLIASTAVSTVLVIGTLKLYFLYVVGFSMAFSQLLLFSFIYAFSSLLYNLVHFSNHYLHRENTLKLTAEKQQREVLEMEMTEFKNDINPDLLYEGLENVINLMNRKQDDAEEYIDYLASAYRYVLSNRQRELIDLSHEAEAAKTIVRLLNERYTGLIKLHCSPSDKESKLCLIPGSLPVVIEYIIRNTIISYQEPFAINCFIEEDEYLVIQSKLNDRLIKHTESALAFERLKKSYSLYSEKPLIQVKAYEENYIKLPLLRIAEDALIHTA
jgi:LytS/YehU family sensor histidine kinase